MPIDNRIVEFENTYLLTDFNRNARVGHGCRQAGKRLRAAQAHRQLEDLQRVQKSRRCRLAADNVERKRGARTQALSREQTAGGGGFVVMREVVNPFHLVVVAQIIRYVPRILVGLFHSQAQRFERAAEHPAGMRIQLGADRASQRLDVFHDGF